ncbi:right-handed parallel beta-helix repeat-containing protein [Sphingobacterium oryzagri]|uniref:Right-handed parallel beta-helix repeat-containing protein n=1 Tax=Sphingobacterium oryzagri TaxID=3025669 RepID=A0ABY7WFR4_9SPHI|nr:right-handed parallel beta-helix repeat-containing protein [Sphingobacterium sp. KACC 22765]WDF67317.1 right-handed parallel beta-helix repeat-containing protein [Sphingobacterium sp. KACC 22765]
MKKVSSIVLSAAIIAAGSMASMTSCSKNDPIVEVPQEHLPLEENVTGNVSGTWRKGSTIFVKGHLVVPKGQSLTIEEGVTVIMDSNVAPEVLIEGSFYAMGTAENPILISVKESDRTAANALGGLWGGLLAAPSSEEILLEHTILEYGGGETTEASPSVLGQYYKAAAGQNVPALWTSNVNAKVVVINCTLRHFKDDAFYLEGGKTIIANNKFYTTGESGGESINTKSGVVADIAFNLIYSPNTNALKLSNSGDRSPQGFIKAYNNTILNAGWRRPTAKGGSIWVEKEIHAEIYNNLLVNNRYGIKYDSPTGPDARNIYANNYYYGNNQQAVDQFQANEANVIIGQNEVRSATAGANDPLFVNYPLTTSMTNATFDESWDFRLRASSPALGKGKTDIVRNFPTGILIKGKNYVAPAAASYVGAFAGQ